MAAELVGVAFSIARQRLARFLARVGLRPDHLTILGVLFTCGAGVAIALGRPYWRVWGIPLIFLAGACDMLDGEMAKEGKLATRFGGILDSCCDRISDAVLFAGLGLYFAWMPDVPAGAARQANLTLLVLVFLGALWAYLTSYIRARAENSVPSCGGGFWQRGERVVTFFVGLVFVNPTMIVWILGLWPATTVAHRFWRARRASALVEAGQSDAVATLQPKGLLGVLLWRWDRHGLPFDLHIGVPILMLALGNIPATFDPLRRLLEASG